MIESHLRNSKKISYQDVSQVIPTHGRGIYAAWLEQNDAFECIYIGKAGNLHKRIKNHYSGQRGSDQFCLYISDSYLKATLDGVGAHLSKQLNKITQTWIRENIKFTYIEFDEDTVCETEQEKHFRKVWQPTLNPL